MSFDVEIRDQLNDVHKGIVIGTCYEAMRPPFSIPSSVLPSIKTYNTIVVIYRLSEPLPLDKSRGF